MSEGSSGLRPEQWRELGGVAEFESMVTRSQSMRELFGVIERVADCDAPVLVRGETGTGKELVSTAIHRLSPRRNGPFLALNCAALPPALLESELFGHVRGAFTGAVKDTPGHFKLASGGTLFLDEIAELPMELQAKLLRVLETGVVTPVGGRQPQAVDVRVVSATHRALRQDVEAGRFRADLMYRLRVIPVRLPPLRDRPDDIEMLALRTAAELNGRRRRQIERIDPEAVAVLKRWTWPGNIRELRNVITYAYVIGRGPVLVAADLPPELFEEIGVAAPARVVMPTAPPMSERELLVSALEAAHGSRQRAAEALGVSRVTLWRRLKAAGIEE